MESFPGYHPEEREENLERLKTERMKLKMMNNSEFYDEVEEEQE